MNKQHCFRLWQLMRGCLLFRFDNMQFPMKGLGYKKASNYFLSRLQSRVRNVYPLSYPVALQLEPTIDCQLHCTLCPRLRAIKGQDFNYMDFTCYQKLMDELGPYLLCIAFWQWGEPLLHPRLPDMIQMAHNYGILTFLSTNAQADPDEIDLQALFRSGLDMLIISMDGVTQQVYQEFRQGGSVERVRRFTAAAVQAKKTLQQDNPLINVRIIATRNNEAEIEQVKSFAEQAGADVFSVKNVSLYYDADPAHPVLPRQIKYRSFQYKGAEEAYQYQQIPNLCTKSWCWPTIRHDGSLLVCECDHDMSQLMGNVFTARSFREVWAGPAAQEIRRHFSRDGKIDLDFCMRCRYKLDDAFPVVNYLR